LIAFIVDPGGEVSLEVVDLVVGRVGYKVPLVLASELCAGRELLSDCDSLAQLPVCLTVELISTDEDSSALLSCVEEHAISRHALVVVDSDDVSNFERL
jgi:hypothetical protein